MTATTETEPRVRSTSYATDRGVRYAADAAAGRYGYPAAPLAASAPQQGQPRLDEMRFWVGAAMTSTIAAMSALVGGVVVHGILKVNVFGSGADHATMLGYALAAAGIAFAFSALYAGMLRVAPRPAAYYGAIAGMATVLAVLLPFTTIFSLHEQAALAGMNLCVGAVIAVLVPLAAITARGGQQ